MTMTLKEALNLIANAHIPDQPATYAGDDLTWAQRHVATLRKIARDAVAEDTDPAILDELDRLRVAEATSKARANRLEAEEAARVAALGDIIKRRDTEEMVEVLHPLDDPNYAARAEIARLTDAGAIEQIQYWLKNNCDYVHAEGVQKAIELMREEL